MSNREGPAMADPGRSDHRLLRLSKIRESTARKKCNPFCPVRGIVGRKEEGLTAADGHQELEGEVAGFAKTDIMQKKQKSAGGRGWMTGALWGPESTRAQFLVVVVIGADKDKSPPGLTDKAVNQTFSAALFWRAQVAQLQCLHRWPLLMQAQEWALCRQNPSHRRRRRRRRRRR